MEFKPKSILKKPEERNAMAYQRQQFVPPTSYAPPNIKLFKIMT